MGHDYYDRGDAGIIGIVFALLWWLIAAGGIAAITYAVLTLARSRRSGSDAVAAPADAGVAPSARLLLDQRLANGEIEVDEYKARVEALGGA